MIQNEARVCRCKISPSKSRIMADILGTNTLFSPSAPGDIFFGIVQRGICIVRVNKICVVLYCIKFRCNPDIANKISPNQVFNFFYRYFIFPFIQYREKRKNHSHHKSIHMIDLHIINYTCIYNPDKIIEITKG